MRRHGNRVFTCVAMLAVALIAQRGYSALKDLTWVGGTADDDFQTAANWSPVETPSYDHRLVFEKDATPCINSADKAYAGQIVVREGCQVTVTTTQSNGRCILKEGSAASGQVVVDIEADAVLTFQAGMPTLYDASANPTFVKRGEGVFCCEQGISGGTVCQIEAGTLACGGWNASSGRVMVASGAVFRLTADNAISDTVSVEMAQGGTFDLNGKQDEMAGISGKGTVRNGTLVLNFVDGPYAFGGQVADLTLNVVRYGGANIRATTEEQFGLVVGAADALDGLKGVISYSAHSTLTDKTLKDPKNSWLRFAPGIGTFRVATLNSSTTLMGYLEHPLYLEDLDGQPVSLVTRLSQEATATISTLGSGNLYISGYNVSLTGDHFAHTGLIGVDNTDVTLGDGAAAHDFDFTKLGGIDAVSGGSIAIRNDGDVTLAGVVKGAGDLTFDVDTTVEEYRVSGASANVGKTLTIEGGSAWTRYNPGFAFTAANARLVINGGEVSAERSVNDKEAMGDGPVPTGILLGGDHRLTATVELNGGDFWVRGPAGYGVKTFELNGGHLHIPAQGYGPVAGSTTENPTVFNFNGGTMCFSRRAVQSYEPFSPINDDEAIVLRVGAGGATVTDEHVFKNASFFADDDNKFWLKRPFLSGVAEGTDGGVTQRGFYELACKYPFMITGPFVGEGSSTFLAKTVDLSGKSFFGSGDTVLRNHYIKLELRDAAFAFRPHGAGRKLTVGGGGGLTLRSALGGSPVSVEINELAFEPGGALFLSDRNGIGVGTGTSKVRLATPPPLADNGRVLLPVFATVNGVGRSGVLLGYDADEGFTPLTDIGSDFGAGRLVKLDYNTSTPAGRVLQADALVLSEGRSLTLGANTSLTVGTDGRPGYLLMAQGGISGADGATLGFGASEGVLVCGVDGAACECMDMVLVPITSANGLTVVSVPDIVRAGWRGVRLSCANTYSGVTRIGSAIVQAEHPGCFSSGDVYVSGGDRHGGGVRFKCAGGEWANGFHIAGRGIRRQSLDGTSAEAGFAMEFGLSGKVSGSVEIDGLARMIALEGATGEIAGVVSGGKLELLYSDGAVRLSNDNTYSGGTDVILSTLELAKANSAGTGRIWLSSGTLRFVNTEPITFANRIEGVGKIEIAGAPVTFVHDEFGAFADRTFAKGTTLDFPDFAAATVRTAVVLDGGTFKVGAEGLAVSELWGEGTVAGGVLTVTGSVNPSGTVTFATQPALDGATLVVETENGLVGKIVVPEDLDVSTLSVEVVQRGTPVAFSAAFLESAGTLSGSFVTVSLPEKKRKNYSVSVGASVATLNYAKPGVVLLVR